jgi:hypothetical protein
VTSRAQGFADVISPTDTDTDTDPDTRGYLSDASSDGDKLAQHLRDTHRKPKQKPGASQRLDQIEGYLQSLKVAQAEQLKNMMASLQQSQTQAQKQQLSLISKLSKDLRPTVTPIPGEVSESDPDEASSNDENQVTLHASASEFEEETTTSGPGRKRKSGSSTARLTSKVPRREESLPAETEEQEVVTFAKRKKGISQLIGQVDNCVLTYSATPVSITSQTLTQQETFLKDCRLPLSEVVKEALRTTNASLRGVSTEEIKQIPESWRPKDLPKVGPQAVTHKLITRKEVGIKDSGRNHYFTKELPYHIDSTGVQLNASQALGQVRKDALDALQAQSFIEQAMGAAVMIMSGRADPVDPKQAEEALLSADKALKSAVLLNTRMLALSTQVLREEQLKHVFLKEPYKNSLRTMPVQSKETLPHLDDVKTQAREEADPAKEMSQAISTLLRKETFSRGGSSQRGRKKNQRRQQKQNTAPPTATVLQKSHQSFPNRGGYGGRGGRGRFRGRGRGGSNPNRGGGSQQQPFSAAHSQSPHLK